MTEAAQSTPSLSLATLQLKNGWQPIALSEATEPSASAVASRIVLATKRHPQGTEFVTWMRREDNGSTHWGHYFLNDLPAAMRDFEARVSRGY